MFILGIFPDILSYVVENCNSLVSGDEENKQKLIECLEFLRAIACKKLEVKSKYVIIACKIACFDFR